MRTAAAPLPAPAAGGELAAVRGELEQIRAHLDHLLAEYAAPGPDPQVQWRQEHRARRRHEQQALRAELDEARQSLGDAQELQQQLAAARSGMQRAEAEKQAIAAELASLKAACARTDGGGLPPGTAAQEPEQRSPSTTRTTELREASSAAEAFAPPQRPAAASELTLEQALDVLLPFARELAVVGVALGDHRTSEAKAAAVAEAATDSPAEAAAALANVRGNLRAAAPLLPRAERLLRQVLDLHRGWQYSSLGKVDDLPTLDPSLQGTVVSQEDMSILRRLAFPQAPPHLLEPSVVREVREQQFAGSSSVPRPCALIAIGAPSSGKSFLLRHCTEFLQQCFQTPPYAQYVPVDVNYFMSSLFQNEPKLSGVAEFCSHESFVTALAQRRHLLLETVGAHLPGIYGRVIGRLRQAKYRVFICIAVAKISTCRDRAERRPETAGRDPRQLARLFQALQMSTHVLLQRQAELADAILVYDNDADRVNWTVAQRLHLVSAGCDASEAMASVRKMLEVPASFG